MATDIKDIMYYKRCFLHLTRSSRKGEKAPHKPILLLAMIDRVESLINMGIAGARMINQNLIDLNPKLEQFFYKHWNTYVTSEAFSPSFSTPFYHMENEPFWKLVLKKNAVPQGGQNESNLYKYYNGAQIDEDLMLLLLEDDSREELRQTLIKMLQSSEMELPLEEDPVSEDNKSEEKTEDLNKAFWDYFVKFQNEHDGLYKGCPISRSESVSRYSSGAHVTSLLFDKKVRVEVYWAKWEDARNKEIFDHIASHKQEIESQIGMQLDWQRLDEKRACRISITKPYSYKNTADHQPIAELFTSYSTKFWHVIVPYFQNLPGTVSSETPQPVSVSQDEMCKLFQDFMRQNGTSEGSIKKYSTQVANNADVRAIIKQLTGKDSLFLVTSPDEATEIRLAVKAAPCDIKGNHMYSVGISHYTKFLVAWNEQHTPEEEPEPSNVKVRRSNLNFYEMGLSQGDILSWIDDPNITVEVIAPKKVLYQGQPYSLSTLSAILKGYNAKHISPCPYWLYKGKNLSDIYLATYSEPEDDTPQPQTLEPEQTEPVQPEPIQTEPVQEEKKKIIGWSDEEMLLSLDLYFHLPYNQRTRRNPAVIELANLTGRTPASIALRLANYLCFDVEEQKLGHKGMEGGLRQCKPFWNKYADHKEQLHKEAEEIRKKKDPTDVVVLFDHAVDYSFFNYGCTLDKKFHQTIFDVLGGRIERGQRQDIVLIYDGKEYAAQFENVDRHGVKSDTIRLMWKGKADAKLSAYLQQKFPEYKTIADLHDRHEHVPENLLHTALLYKDDGFILKIK